MTDYDKLKNDLKELKESIRTGFANVTKGIKMPEDEATTQPMIKQLLEEFRAFRTYCEDQFTEVNNRLLRIEKRMSSIENENEDQSRRLV